MASPTSPLVSTLDQEPTAIGDVRAALKAKDFPGAARLAKAALIGGLETPLLLNVAAFSLEQEGRLDDAMRLLQRAHEIAPGDLMTLNAIGHWLSKSARPGEALKVFDAVLAAQADYAAAHHGRGLAQAAMKDFEGAWESQLQAVTLDPHNSDVLGALASIAANRNDEVAARAYAEQALAMDPHQSNAVVTLGSLNFQAQRFDEVVSSLEALLTHGGMSGLHTSAAYRLLADALEAQGHYAEAMEAYVAANGILRAANAAVFEAPGVERGPALTERLAAYFSAVPKGAWTTPGPDRTQSEPVLEHVFLVGFPRSGTTLLEQVLATHDKVVALEERLTLGEVGFRFEDTASLDRLADMDAATADDLRRAYWDNVRAFGVEPAGKVFVDKLPLTTLWLPYVAKLFPDAKVVFARRDPRDVVLSCFRRRFLMNGAMYDFTDLVEAARFYAGTMALADVYRQMLPLAWYDHKHEDLVADFDAETRRLCAFLDLPWSETLNDFAETAKRRDVQTPSASQVRRGLYSDGMAQWRRYGEALAPIFPILRLWVQKLGYDA
ncbi:MAG: tetratricopeptide repeat-containing sulfotransferase family protein [Caulobacteraceae bacterium]